jgi:hypothetical protein
MKTFISGLLALVMTVGVFAPATASAASSWNGVYNSDGRSLQSWNYNYQYTNYVQQQQVLQSYIRQLEQLLTQLRAMQQQQWHAGWGNNAWQGGSSEVSVTTRSATDVTDDMATLRGNVDFGNSDEAVVYFQWGTASNRLTEETPNIVLDDSDDEDFSARIDDLDEDRTYFFRAVAEDEAGRVDYGSILSFRGDDYDNDRDDDDDHDSNDDRPDVETLGASSVRTSSAEVRGEVDMNDFEDGYVFLVYGEDEDMVVEIADEYDEYGDIDTNGDNLQKTGIYSGLDDYRTFWTSISGLDEDTEIYYAYCVEYEDEDNDETIICGDTESFTTDED